MERTRSESLTQREKEMINQDKKFMKIIRMWFKMKNIMNSVRVISKNTERDVKSMFKTFLR